MVERFIPLLKRSYKLKVLLACILLISSPWLYGQVQEILGYSSQDRNVNSVEPLGAEKPGVLEMHGNSSSSWSARQLSRSERDGVVKLISNMRRVVHIDLKGAAPSVGYLTSLFLMLNKWGATSLLIEWDLTFPYSKLLWVENKPDTSYYSPKQAEEILHQAAFQGLEVIPLVDICDIDSLLKQTKFFSLHKNQTADLDSSAIIEGEHEVIDQIMRVHRSALSKYLHIGCENSGDDSDSIGPPRLHNMLRISDYLKTAYGTEMVTLIWADVFQGVDVDVLKAFNIGDWVQPVVRSYGHPIRSLDKNVMEKYELIFPAGIWLAGSYKGTTEPMRTTVDIQHHYMNQLSWISTISLLEERGHMFKGYMLMGPQRHDKFSTLSELLPASVPSLIICLATIKHTRLSKKTKQEIHQDLGCEPVWHIGPVSSLPSKCAFPGHKIYTGMMQLYLITIRGEWHDRTHGAWLRFDNPSLDRASNPLRFESMTQALKGLLNRLENIENSMIRSFGRVFEPSVLGEIRKAHISPLKKAFRERLALAQQRIGGYV